MPKFITNIPNAKTLLIIQFLVIIYLVYKLSNDEHNYDEEETFSEFLNRMSQEFYSIGFKHGTSKTFTNNYHRIYGSYLGPRRYEKLDLLEIGLGCDMGSGPGKSLATWREYLPNTRITILERDAKCAESLRLKIDQLFIGDQIDFGLLKQVADAGPYDVIVDDGGHTRKQQINSLIGLWPAVKSGGLYVIEGINFSYLKEYMDASASSYEWVVKLIYVNLFRMPNAIQNPVNIPLPDELKSISEQILSVNCYYHACTLIKI